MSENANIRRPKSLEEAYELAKNFRRIPTRLISPSPPPEDLPPEEYQKAWQEYERQAEEYWLQKTYGANYKDNPLYQFREPYLKAEWEAIKDLVL